MEIKYAVQRISDEFEIPFHNAILFRIDIGTNLCMKNPVSDYLMLLDNHRRIKKSIIKDYQTVYFSTTERQITFYDKLAQFKPKFEIPFSSYTDNILRVELRYKKKIADEFDIGRNIKVSDLYDVGFYNNLLNRLVDEYFKIIKTSKPIINKKPNVHLLTSYYGKIGLNLRGGLNNAFVLIDSLQRRFEFGSTLPKYKAVVFVHGCFWHGHMCKAGKLPKTRIEFWTKKIRNNKVRDMRNIEALQSEGWKVNVIWECEIKTKLARKIRLIRLIEDISCINSI